MTKLEVLIDRAIADRTAADLEVIDRALGNYWWRIRIAERNSAHYDGLTRPDTPDGPPDRDRCCIVNLKGLPHVFIVSEKNTVLALYRIRKNGRLRVMPIWRADPYVRRHYQPKDSRGNPIGRSEWAGRVGLRMPPGKKLR